MDPKKPTSYNDKKEAVAPVIDQADGKDINTVASNNNGKAATGEYDYNPTRVIGTGSQVKQAAIAKAISGNGGASGSGVSSTVLNSGLRSIPYSGADARIIDNASGTPAFNKSDRRDSRYGQKTDNTARHINNTPSETYELAYDGPKPLSESPDSVQGSLGHPANEFARIQKGSEAFPGALNFERSVDEMTQDLVLATSGQQLKYGGDANGYNDVDPSITFNNTDPKVKIPYNIHRGNYIPRTVHIRYENGHLADYYYDEESFEASAEGNLVAERANTNRIVQANQAEVDRQAMAANAGNEVKENWSPIPFAYPEPTKDVMYLSTIERQLGAQVYTAVKMSAKAHSYQLNKATKDGMVSARSAAQMAVGDVVHLKNSADYDGFTVETGANVPEGKASVFTRYMYRQGAPSAIIAMYDSVSKYHDRADFLTQPRSWNMILKQGLSGYKSFRAYPYFMKALDNTNNFSTIDRGYDPSSTVCVTDAYGLMNAYSLNELGSCHRAAKLVVATETNVDPLDMIDTKQLSFTDSENGIQVYTTVGPFDVSKADIDLTDAAFGEKYGRDAIRKAFAKFGHKAFASNFAVVYGYYDKEEMKEKFKLMIYSYAQEFEVDDDPSKFEWKYIVPNSSTVLTYTDASGTELSKGNINSTYNMGTVSVYNDYLAAWYKNRQNWYYLELRDPYTDGLKTFLRLNAGLMTHVTENNALDWPIAYGTKDINAYCYLVMAAIKYMQEQRAKAFLDVLNYAKNFGYPFGHTVDCSEYMALGGSQYGQSDIFELLEVRQASPASASRWLFPEMYARMGSFTMMPMYMNEDNFSITGLDSVSLAYDRASMSYPVTKDGVRWGAFDTIYGFTERDNRLMLDMMVCPPCFNGKDTCTMHEVAVYKYSQASDGLIAFSDGGVNMRAHLSTPRELGIVFPVCEGYLTKTPSETIGESLIQARKGETDYISGNSSHRVFCWINDAVSPSNKILSSGSSVIARAANFSQKCYVFTVKDEHPGHVIGLAFGTGDVTSSSSSGINKFRPFTDGIFTGNGQSVKGSAPELSTYAKALWTRIQKIPCAINPFDFGGENVTVDPFSFNYLFGLMGFRASDFKEDLYSRLSKRMSEMWLYVEDPFMKDSLLLK